MLMITVTEKNDFFSIQALEVKKEIECPEIFVDDPHSGEGIECK